MLRYIKICENKTMKKLFSTMLNLQNTVILNYIAKSGPT